MTGRRNKESGVRSVGIPGAVVAARSALSRHLIHTREVPNGRDFLFSGPSDEIHDALKTLVDAEHHAEPSLQLDYAQVEEYFLLRVVGSSSCGELIRNYFPQRPKG